MKVRGQLARDARWVLGWPAGTPWVSGAFRPNRERELIRLGVLIPSEAEGTFTVGANVDTADWD